MAKRRNRQFPSGPRPQPKPPNPSSSAGHLSDAGPNQTPASPLLDSLVCESDNQELLAEQEQSKDVPMEYRAQVPGRCQRQYINKPKDAPPGWRSDAQQWVDEWVKRVDSRVPFQGEGLRLIDVQIDWRLISNSGMDEGFIRPVIGAGGWPLVPGSGIKGLFRRACPLERLQRWCGSPCGAGDLKPGLLRFHGAWPVDALWTMGLLDVAHPQQNWQVGFHQDQRRNSHSAFALASLRQPRLQIGLSSTDPDLQEAEWQEIEDTLRRGLQRGLGGRTCAGYGSSGRLHGDLVFECELEGQGPAAKLLDQTAEFRPTMFRAAIRGMALRLFGGVTDEDKARQAVGRLFGSLSREEGQNVGLLATAYTDVSVELGSDGRRGWEQPTFTTSGRLQWRLTRECSHQESKELLQDLLAALHGLTMTLGGFGRGWRRPDHRIFLSSYDKTPIGCHWEWRNEVTLPGVIRVQSAADLGKLLSHSRKVATRWLVAAGFPTGSVASWREVLHPDKMLIWARLAKDAEDAEVIRWFHEPRDGEQPRDPRDLRKSELAGKVNQVGRVWNRLLPLQAESTQRSRPASPTARPGSAVARPSGSPTARPTSRPVGSAMARPSNARQQQPTPKGIVSMNYSHGPFLESLVLFPEKRQSPAFIREMDRGAGAEFKRVNFS